LPLASRVPAGGKESMHPHLPQCFAGYRSDSECEAWARMLRAAGLGLKIEDCEARARGPHAILYRSRAKLRAAGSRPAKDCEARVLRAAGPKHSKAVPAYLTAACGAQPGKFPPTHIQLKFLPPKVFSIRPFSAKSFIRHSFLRPRSSPSRAFSTHSPAGGAGPRPQAAPALRVRQFSRRARV
jgi:hypothetical protein